MFWSILSQECAKDEGELCGGPWNTSGECASYLTCEKEGPPLEDEFNWKGVCRNPKKTNKPQQKFYLITV